VGPDAGILSRLCLRARRRDHSDCGDEQCHGENGKSFSHGYTSFPPSASQVPWFHLSSPGRGICQTTI